MPVSISGTTGYAGPLGAITVDTGSIVNNAVTPAKLSRTGTAGQVLTSGGAGADPSYTSVTAVTSITAGGGLTGGTITSTGTIAVDTTFAAIGTYSLFWSTLNAKTYSGTTVSGSYLYYISATGSGVDPQSPGAGSLTVNNNRVNATSSFTSGVGVSAITFTNVSGTWRCLGSIKASTYEACPNITTITSTLWVRVS